MLHVTFAMQVLPRKKWPKIKSVEKVVGCDWLTKQVARAMLHVFLLCNLKKFVAESRKRFNFSCNLKKKFSCVKGCHKQKSCVQLAAIFFLRDKLHEKLLHVTAAYERHEPNKTRCKDN